MRASAADLTTKPHRSAPERLRRLTALRRGRVRTDPGGASPYHPPITQPSPTGRPRPDQEALTCYFMPALDWRRRPWTVSKPVPYGTAHAGASHKASPFQPPSAPPARTKPRDRKDPDHTRTNRAAKATSYTIAAAQGLESAVPPADQEPAGALMALSATVTHRAFGSSTGKPTFQGLPDLPGRAFLGRIWGVCVALGSRWGESTA